MVAPTTTNGLIPRVAAWLSGWERLRVLTRGLRAPVRGLRAPMRGLRAPVRGLRAPVRTSGPGSAEDDEVVAVYDLALVAGALPGGEPPGGPAHQRRDLGRVVVDQAARDDLAVG